MTTKGKIMPIINEGIVEHLPRSFKEKLVKIRQPFKEYGSIVPERLTKEDLNNTHHVGSDKLSGYGGYGGYGGYSGYHFLTGDTRPRRSQNILTEGILSKIGNLLKPKPSLVIETTPHRKRLSNAIEKKKQAIKNEIYAIDKQKELISKVQPTKEEYQRHLDYTNRGLSRGWDKSSQPKSTSNKIISSKIVQKDINNPYNAYINKFKSFGA